VARPIDKPVGAFQGCTICTGAPLGDPNMAVAGFALIKEDNGGGAHVIAGATPDVIGMGPVGMLGLSKSAPRSRKLMTAALEPAGRDIEGWAYPASGKPKVRCGVRAGSMRGWVGAPGMAV